MTPITPPGEHDATVIETISPIIEEARSKEGSDMFPSKGVNAPSENWDRYGLRSGLKYEHLEQVFDGEVLKEGPTKIVPEIGAKNWIALYGLYNYCAKVCHTGDYDTDKLIDRSLGGFITQIVAKAVRDYPHFMGTEFPLEDLARWIFLKDDEHLDSRLAPLVVFGPRDLDKLDSRHPFPAGQGSAVSAHIVEALAHDPKRFRYVDQGHEFVLNSEDIWELEVGGLEHRLGVNQEGGEELGLYGITISTGLNLAYDDPGRIKRYAIAIGPVNATAGLNSWESPTAKEEDANDDMLRATIKPQS